MSKRDVLKRLVADKTLSPHGLNWFKMAADPFHDEALECSGFPDSESANTIVQCIEKQLVISAPSGTTGNWDCHIASLPACYEGHTDTNGGGQVSSYSLDQFAHIQFNSPTNWGQGGLGGVQISCQPTGAITYQSATADPAVASTTSTYSGLGVSEYFAGSSRLIGAGFEVHNTTAPLYKQGDVTCYRQPSCIGIKAYGLQDANDAPTGFISNLPVVAYRGPPSVIADAQILKGSVTWEAESGAYVTSRMCSRDNPLKSPGFLPISAEAFDQQVPYNSATTVRLAMLASASNHNDPPYLADSIQPYDVSGAYFTGLSPQTTLKLVCKWFVERAPTATDRDLVVLATPSPAADDAAIKLYMRAMSMLPPGVKVAENSVGDWFKRVLGVVEKAAPYVGKVANAFVPGSGEVVEKIGEFAARGKQAIQDRQDRKKKK